jgi:hypothetical protein
MGTNKEIAEKARRVKALQADYLKAQKASNRALADYKRELDDLLEVL